MDSHRTSLGGRLNYTADPQYTPYIGLAWEHEFREKPKEVHAVTILPKKTSGAAPEQAKWAYRSSRQRQARGESPHPSGATSGQKEGGG